MPTRHLAFLTFFLLLTIVNTAQHLVDSNLWNRINQRNTEVFHLRNTNPDSGLMVSLALYDSFRIPYDSLVLSNMYSVTGTLYDKKQSFQKALQYFFKCLEIREALGLIDAVGRIQLNIANTYYQSNNLELAMQYILESIQNRKAAKVDEIKLVRPYNSLGLMFLEQDQFDSALSYFHKGLHILHQFKRSDNTDLTDVLSNIGLIHSSTSNLDSALHYFKWVENILSDSSDLEGLAWAQNHIGKIFTRKGNYKEAEKYLNNAYYLASRIGSIEEQRDLMWSKLRLSIRQNKTSIALDNMNAYRDLNQSFLDNVVSSNIQEMDAKYQNEKKEQENVRLMQEKELIQAQSDLLILIVTGLGILSLLLGVIIWFRYQQRKKEKIISQQNIDQLIKDQELKSLNAMMEGQETERTRIAEDLHDRLGSILSTVKLYFSSIDDKMTNLQDQNQQQYQKAKSLLTDAISEVRNISQNMVSGVLINFGLKTALQDLVDTVEGSEKVQINLIINNLNERIKNRAEINIYRIVQELLSNILKYAKASHVVIQLNKENHQLNLMIEDDGIGFDTQKLSKSKGMGFKNVQKRVDILNGRITIDSYPGKGTTITITDLVVD